MRVYINLNINLSIMCTWKIPLWRSGAVSGSHCKRQLSIMGCDSPGKDARVNPFPVLWSSVQACRDLFDSFSICLINRLKALEGKRLQLWDEMDAVCSAPSTELDGRRQRLPPGRALWQLQKELVTVSKAVTQTNTFRDYRRACKW